MPMFVRLLLLLGICFTAVAPAISQEKPPDPKDYPVAARDRYKKKPVSPKIDNRRARTYRTVIREGAKQGPNFAGRYTIVTWGAGLGTFSMAVVDAKTGNIYFPPFKSVYGSGFGLPYIDDGSNPAWRIDSRLFAFFGQPEEGDKGIGLYVYSFDRGQFSLLYFEKEDEEKRKAEQVEWEKELDRRMDSMSNLFGDFRKRLSELQPNVWCFGRPSGKYPIPAFNITCTENDLIVSVNLNYHTTPVETAEMNKSDLKFSELPNWRSVDALGEEGIEADNCSRAWIRFRKGTYFVWMNANLNKEGMDDPKCSNEQNADSKRLSEFTRRVAFLLADLL